MTKYACGSAISGRQRKPMNPQKTATTQPANMRSAPVAMSFCAGSDSPPPGSPPRAPSRVTSSLTSLTGRPQRGQKRTSSAGCGWLHFGQNIC